MKPVRVTIDSKQQGDHVHLVLDGMLAFKGETLYIRYFEPEEQGMGRTSTTVKVSFDELRVIRRGEVEAEQVFRMNETMPGAYRIGAMRIPMATKLLRLTNRLKQGLGEISWQYELHLEEQKIDAVEVRIRIEERTDHVG
jgi:uncharacterized beta-barrel protein YwiB (DUF1934 family)